MTPNHSVAARRLALAALLVAASCSKSSTHSSGPIALRLVDSFKPEMVEGSPSSVAAAQPPRNEWRFAGPEPVPPPKPELAPTRGWEAWSGIADLAIRDGRLAGRATSDLPILHLALAARPDDSDDLHSIVIRLRASAGANLSVGFDESDDPKPEEIVGRLKEFPMRRITPLVAGPDLQTYTIANDMPVAASGLKHLLIRPTDSPDATFEIESVRLIFRAEHLASIPSGIGFHGLHAVFRETIVSRSPETIRVPLVLPERPWLELAIGTIEDAPVTFRVAVRSGGTETVALERTVTTADRWEETPIDLAAFGGRAVTLSLSLAAERGGVLGFWGTPVVRARGAEPPPTVGGPGPAPPQGVILIQADTLRSDHLDAYGYSRPTAPVVTRMAAEGALFRSCISQATWTKVSSPSIQTSLYPTSHGVFDFMDRLPASAVTLAEVFRSAGFATLSLSSVLFTGQFTNLQQGYEQLHEQASLSQKETSKTARELVDRLLPWLEAHREGPFFVFLHVFDPHDPYEPRRPYDSLWADPEGKKEHERQTEEARKVIADSLMKRFGMPNREELVKAGLDPDAYVGYDRDWYDGSIRAMDVEIGRLLERLKALGLAERTLVTFTSDHGEEFLEHGRMFHGQTAYGELTHVPLVLHWPGVVPAGAAISEPVESIDIMPTILELCRLPLPAAAQGQSLVPLIGIPGAKKGRWRERPAVTEKNATKSEFGPPPRKEGSIALVDGDWKLVRNLERPEGRAEFELYEWKRDPLDRTDVATQHPDLVKRLAAEVDSWRARTEAARLPSDAESTQSMDQHDLDRLRSLGYIR